MAIPKLILDKTTLRKFMRAELQKPHSSAKVCDEVISWLSECSPLRTVATYSSLPGEVDLSQAVLARPDLRWVYPKVRGLNLNFHETSELTPGAFGILEPHGDSPEVPLEAIDAFLCPGIAFDPKGGRLGRGKGFYDRLLEKARKDAIKVGICYRFQVVENTFSEAHDIRMDRVLHD